MATIYPFRPIRPNPIYADQLVFTKPQAESVSGDYTKEGGLMPLKILLEAVARQKPETPEGQAEAYQEIDETLKTLLEREQLWQENTDGIYIYEVTHTHYRQTGVWALSSLDDYRDGTIRIHELTFADSVRRLKNYRENTGLEGSPVLLTYLPDARINRIITETKLRPADEVFANQQGMHKLWKIEDEAVHQKLGDLFQRIGEVYLADGHHRMASACQLAQEQQQQGLPVFDKISSLYMATDQLRIEQYDRVVIPEAPADSEWLMRMLTPNFKIEKSENNQPVIPAELHRIGMYHSGQWYQLLVKTSIYSNKDLSSSLDAAILQEQVLAPVFGITDPKTDSRLKCVGGEKAIEEINVIVGAHEHATVFMLCPLSIESLIAVADAGQILPPKSTWIVPKVPYGLLLHQHKINSV